MQLKHNVVTTGVQTEMIFAVLAAQRVFSDYGYDCIITSGVEGQHSRYSRHYIGYALDFRIRHILEEIRDEVVQDIVKDIQQSLSTDYQVILESTHIHIQYKPGRP